MSRGPTGPSAEFPHRTIAPFAKPAHTFERYRGETPFSLDPVETNSKSTHPWQSADTTAVHRTAMNSMRAQDPLNYGNGASLPAEAQAVPSVSPLANEPSEWQPQPPTPARFPQFAPSTSYDDQPGSAPYNDQPESSSYGNQHRAASYDNQRGAASYDNQHRVASYDNQLGAASYHDQLGATSYHDQSRAAPPRPNELAHNPQFQEVDPNQYVHYNGRLFLRTQFP